MLAFIIQRLLQSVLVMLTVALIAFALFNYVGDPISNMVGQDTTSPIASGCARNWGSTTALSCNSPGLSAMPRKANFGLSYQQARPVGRSSSKRCRRRSS
jgi:peptide/nickel transport system permease protein